jgi:hypothetical protein
MACIVQVHAKKKGPWKIARASRGTNTALQNFHDFAGLEALVAVREIKLDLFACVQAPIPILLDNRVVNKDIIAVVLGDEAIPLGVVKPFDLSLFHHVTTSSSDGPPGDTGARRVNAEQE